MMSTASGADSSMAAFSASLSRRAASPLRPFRRSLARPHGDAGPRGRPRLHEGADRFTRVAAQDEELDAAPRAAFLAHHFAQGLQLAVVGRQAEAQIELGADLERDRRFEEEAIDADVERVAFHHVAVLGDARPGLQAHGDARVPAPRHLQQLVETGVPEGGVRLQRDHDVRPRRAQEVRVGQERMAAHRRDRGRARVRVLAQAADGPGGVGGRGVEHDEVGDEGAHGLHRAVDVRGERALDVVTPEHGAPKVDAEIGGRDDEDLEHGGRCRARV
jgi:hypothetical protein